MSSHQDCLKREDTTFDKDLDRLVTRSVYIREDTTFVIQI
jgi:hypothetical protein